MRWVELSIVSILSTGCSLIGTADLRADGSGGEGGGAGSTTTGAVVSSTAGGMACGNGVVDPDEACDGSLGGHDCTEAGYVNPEGASCEVACAISYAGCEAECGNNTVEPGEECDGDPGCNACVQEALGTCASPITTGVDFGVTTLMGATSGASQETTQRCGGSGPERVYAIDSGATGFLTATIASPVQGSAPVLSIRRSCQIGEEITCHASDNGKPVVVSVHVSQGERVYLIVDGAQGQGAGFEMSVTLTRGTCEDPVPILVAQPAFEPLRLFGTTTGQPSNHQGSCGGQGPEVVYRVLSTNGGVNTEMTATKSGGGNSAPAVYLRSSCNIPQSEFDCDSVPVTNVISNGMASVFLFVDSPAMTLGDYFVDIGYD